jgi:mRNA interferase MazF
MKRGDLVTVALPGAYGKPRPAVVIQSNAYQNLTSVTFLPLSSDILPAKAFRVTIEPTDGNGLRVQSQVLADKCSTLPAGKIGPAFGRLAEADLGRVDVAIAGFLGLA